MTELEKIKYIHSQFIFLYKLTNLGSERWRTDKLKKKKKHLVKKMQRGKNETPVP